MSEETKTSSILDDILVNDDPTFTFKSTLTGRVFTGKRLRSTNDLGKIFARAKHLASLDKKKTPPIYHEHLPLSDVDAKGVAYIEQVLIDPPITTIEAIQLAATRGAYFLEIVNNIQMELLGQKSKAEEEALEELGEDSGGTDAAVIS